MKYESLIRDLHIQKIHEYYPQISTATNLTSTSTLMALCLNSQNRKPIFVEHKYSIPLGGLLINIRKDHVPNPKDPNPKRTLCPHGKSMIKRINW